MLKSGMPTCSSYGQLDGCQLSPTLSPLNEHLDVKDLLRFFKTSFGLKEVFIVKVAMRLEFGLQDQWSQIDSAVTSLVFMSLARQIVWCQRRRAWPFKRSTFQETFA